uniref:Fibronectin type-III domain-containing protein n=1 Tax=Guillardia theta TaxID=55529 RepID=A0A7S4NLA7_GUITH
MNALSQAIRRLMTVPCLRVGASGLLLMVLGELRFRRAIRRLEIPLCRGAWNSFLACFCPGPLTTMIQALAAYSYTRLSASNQQMARWAVGVHAVGSMAAWVRSLRKIYSVRNSMSVLPRDVETGRFTARLHWDLKSIPETVEFIEIYFSSETTCPETDNRRIDTVLKSFSPAKRKAADCINIEQWDHSYKRLVVDRSCREKNSEDLSVTVKGLRPGLSYSMFVVGVSKGGVRGNQSKIFSFTTSGGILGSQALRFALAAVTCKCAREKTMIDAQAKLRTLMNSDPSGERSLRSSLRFEMCMEQLEQGPIFHSSYRDGDSSLRSVWEDPLVSSERATKAWEHLVSAAIAMVDDLRIVWWGNEKEEEEAPFFVACNSTIAVICISDQWRNDEMTLKPNNVVERVGFGRMQREASELLIDVCSKLHNSPQVWRFILHRELLVTGFGLAGAAAHLWSAQELKILSWPVVCKTFYSVALAPPFPGDTALASKVRASQDSAFENVFFPGDPVRYLPAYPLTYRLFSRVGPWFRCLLGSSIRVLILPAMLVSKLLGARYHCVYSPPSVSYEHVGKTFLLQPQQPTATQEGQPEHVLVHEERQPWNISKYLRKQRQEDLRLHSLDLYHDKLIRLHSMTV